MAIEPLGSVMTFQAQPVQKQAAPQPAVEVRENPTPEQAANVDATTVSVAQIDRKDEQGSSAEQDGQQSQQQASNEQIRKAVERMNKNMAHSEAVFGIHEKTNRVTIKIVDKDTKEVIKELPPEKTLDMIAKAWELAGLLVDEKR